MTTPSSSTPKSISSTRLALIIVGALLGLAVIGGVVYGVVGFSAYKDSLPDAARIDADQLHGLAAEYKRMKRKCPASSADLITAGLLGRDRLDPWGRGYAIACDDAGSITVTSAGPDGVEGTADDVIKRGA